METKKSFETVHFRSSKSRLNQKYEIELLTRAFGICAKLVLAGSIAV